MKNILFLNSNKIRLYDLPWAFIEAGYKVNSIDFSGDYIELEEENQKKLEAEIKSVHYEFVLTYNFLIPISKICNKLQIKYISWTFDSPLLTLFTETTKLEYNYIFVFDKGQFNRLQKLDIPHLFYLPLAVNMTRVGALEIKPEDEIKYSGDVSFVGNLYHGNSFNSLSPHLSEENKLYFENIFAKASKNICEKNLEAYVDEGMLKFFEYVLTESSKNKYIMSNSYYYADKFLSRKISEIDRINVLSEMAKEFEVKLYTDNDSSMIKNIIKCPPVTYETNMYKVFYLSKINLNITIRAIETGLPLRIFDCLGCGGFLMTNYQEEINDYFEPDKDLVVYTSIEELVDKTRYYLNHEDERLKISLNGYIKVRENHTYAHRIKKIIELCGL